MKRFVLYSVFLILYSVIIFVSPKIMAFTGPTCAAPNNCSVLNASGTSLGVNTANPAAALDIQSASGNQLRLSYSAGSYYWILERDSSGKFNLIDHNNAANVTALTSNNSGYIGIATTTSPGYPLTVQGNVFTTGAYYGSASQLSSINPANISGGPFAATVYAFPGAGGGAAALVVGTSTTSNQPQALNVYGNSYFNGNVGIGTTTPSAQLDITQTFRTLSGSQVAPTTGKGLEIYYNGTTDSGVIQSYDRGASAYKALTIQGGGNGIALNPTSGGNVGIGTTTPPQAMTVNGSILDYQNGGGAIRLTTSGGVSYLQSGSSSLVSGNWQPFSIGPYSVATPSYFYVNGSGNVGIGTTTPTSAGLVVSTNVGGVALDVQNSKIINVATPTNASDAATKSYVDSVTGGSGSVVWVLSGSNIYPSSTSWNVGIATTTPPYALTIGGSSQLALFGDGGAVNTYIGIAGGGSSQQAGRVFIGYDSASANAVIQAGVSKGIEFNVGSNTIGSGFAMGITSGGKVGIATSTPVATLDTLGTIRALSTTNVLPTSGKGVEIRYDSSADVGEILSYDRVAPGWKNLALDYGGGNVGIGTSTPTTANLVVAGGNPSIDAQSGRIINLATPTAASDAVTKSYVDSAVLAATSTQYWTLNSSNLYPNSTSYNVGIGTTTPSKTLQVVGNALIGSGSNPSSTLSIMSSSTTNAVLNLQNGGNTFRLSGGAAGGIGGGLRFSQVSTLDPLFDLNNNNMIYYGTHGNLSGDLTIGATDNLAPTSGLYSSSSSYLAVKSGNVGIGTTTPTTANLVVAGGNPSIDVNNGRIINVGTPTQNGDAVNLSTLNTALTSVSPFYWLQSGSYLYPSSTSWNVGIGTTTPTTALVVNGTSTIYGNVNVGTNYKFASGKDYGSPNASNDSYIVPYDSNGAMDFYSLYNGASSGGFNFYAGGSATPAIRISTSSNVGIGTTTPAALLTVNGQAQATNFGALSYAAGNNVDFTGSNVTINAYNNSGSNFYVQSRNAASALAYKIAIPNNSNAINLTGAPVVIGGTSSSSFALNTNSATWTMANDYGDSSKFKLYYNANAPALTVQSNGNVGIGTTTPTTANLVVAGGNPSIDVNNGRIINVATPVVGSDAATMSYVNSIIAGGSATSSFATITVSGTSTLSGNWSLGGAAQGNVNMNGYNISGVNKISVTAIDPLYEIDGHNYSTYASAIAGGVNEEYVGKGTLAKTAGGYQYTLDFDEVKDGSDLWVWRNVVDFSADNVDAFATPIGTPAAIAYQVQGNEIIFTGTAPVQFSYRLVGKRVDWQNWPTYAQDQSETPSLIIK